MTSLAALVMALAIVETGNVDVRAIGPHGETGAWQLTPAVRHDRALDLQLRGHADPSDEQLATEHVRWLQLTLELYGVEATDFNVALAWNAGAKRVLAGKAPVASYDFARRVCAVAEELKQQTKAAEAAKRNR